jgi:hypothetical protein
MMDFTDCIERGMTPPDVFFGRGECFEQLGELIAAETDFARARQCELNQSGDYDFTDQRR